ncbi:glutathione S-transferase A-like isoform X1 [Polyodon spathula]|uniref:glutathione S-transferase A-like isoform X1 n=1 Tax=Polyodon spathula TaxID=7913 RepID=UPI001B7E8252|nr:glutathione S-transferase A-like isoform X1 [Polyodon spathula]
MASSMFLYWGSGSPPCWRVMIALEEKNLQGYKQKLLSFEKNEHKSEAVMAINPRGQLPSFKHGDNIINESFGACLYLENQFKSQGTQLIPDSPAEQALVYQRMFETLTLHQKMADVIYYTWRVPESERHDSAVNRNKEALSAELQLWEGYFQKMDAGSYAAGKHFTMADVLVFPQIAYAFRFGLSLEKFIKLGEYHNLVKKRPSVEASWPPHWKENPQGMDILKDF